MSVSIHGGYHAHWEALLDALWRLRKDPVRHSAGVLVMAIMLALPGVSWVALRGLDLLIPAEALTPGISVFLQKDADEAALEGLADEINAEEGVFLVELVTADRGLQALSELAGLTELAGAFDTNPLPDVLRVLLAPDTEAGVSRELALRLEGDPRVEFVRLDQGISAEMRNALVLGQRLVMVLAVMVVAAIVLVVTGATRIEVTRARAEIALVDLVGGTMRYARRPFIYMGLLQGAGGGFLAAGFVWLGAELVGAPLSRLVVLYGETGSAIGAGWFDLLLPLVVGTALGGLGARLAARTQSIAFS
ncbi:MAG: cell division protein FtsX [Litorivicinus sp.]